MCVFLSLRADSPSLFINHLTICVTVCECVRACCTVMAFCECSEDLEEEKHVSVSRTIGSLGWAGHSLPYSTEHMGTFSSSTLNSIAEKLWRSAEKAFLEHTVHNLCLIFALPFHQYTQTFVLLSFTAEPWPIAYQNRKRCLILLLCWGLLFKVLYVSERKRTLIVKKHL